MSSSVKVTTSGPLFDGSAPGVIHDLQDDVEAAIGKALVNAIQNELGQVLQHPTGYYRNHVQTDRTHNDVIVSDSDVVYGAWLEGVASRNKASRFKGYATFRRMTRRVQDRAAEIAADVVPPQLDRLR